AAGGVSGRFDTVTSNHAFLRPSLGYAANTVILTLEQRAAFNTAARSSNQSRIADAVESLGRGHPVVDAVIGQSDAGARQAFDALSGEAHGSVAGTALGGAMQTQNLLMNRLHRAGGGATRGPGGAFQVAYAADRPGPVQADSLVLPSLDPQRFALWGEGFGSWGRVAGNANAAALDSTTGGFALGAEARLSEALTLGLAGGFSRTTFDVTGRLSDGANETTFGALYGAAGWGALRLRVGALYAWHDIDVNRTVSFPGFADRVSASYDGSTLMAFGELGYALDLGPVRLEPFLGAAALRLHTARFQESGGSAALT